MKKTKYLIVGAGITGLTFAKFINDNDYIILEKENRVGGYCKTTKRNGFVWDYAGHFYHFKTEYFKKIFEENISKDDIVYKDKNTKIIYNKNIVDYPFQTNIHQLNKEDFINCLYDLFNKDEKEEYSNFLDMLYGKFGKSITDMFLKPYNEKLYAIDLKQLDTNAMGRFFPYANKEEIINNMKKQENNSYNNYFLYPKDGAEAFIEVLYNKIDKNNVYLNTKLEKLDLKNKVAYTADEEIKFEYLINTIPLNNFLEIIAGKEEKKILNNLSYNKVLVFNLGFDKKSSFNKEHWIYLPDKKLNFYRMGFYDNILDTDKLSMYIEIGYSKEDKITKEEIKKQLSQTLENLKKIKVIDYSMKLIDYEVIIMNPAYVHINEKTDDEINDYFGELNKNNIYSIGRYGAWTYCSMEDSMLSAKNLAEIIK